MSDISSLQDRVVLVGDRDEAVTVLVHGLIDAFRAVETDPVATVALIDALDASADGLIGAVLTDEVPLPAEPAA